jgi:S-DNA-T family DNA segregation ATPase FtsK/SpoIIIE
MLWSQSGSKTVRIQGAYVSSDEIDRVVSAVKAQGKPRFLLEDNVLALPLQSPAEESDALLEAAMEVFLERGFASTSSLQTKMKIGYNRAARIIDTLEEKGWIGKPEGPSRKRELKRRKAD